MKKKIFKYKLSDDYTQLVSMPIDAEILCVQVQEGCPVIWASFSADNQNNLGDRIIEICPTGPEVIITECSYVGTYQAGDFVGHVFDGGYTRN